MTKDEHDEAVASLKEICQEIGCSKMSVKMCDERPQNCGIIKMLVVPSKPKKDDEASEHGQHR
jgi:hypothetical protein